MRLRKKPYRSAEGQVDFHFDLPPKLKAIGKLKASLGIRKLLAALATIGCSNPDLVVLGEGGEDGEWLLAPTRKQIAAAGCASVSAFKRWRQLAESTLSPFVTIDRVDSESHSFLVRWPLVFDAADEKWTPAHFHPEAEMDPGPFCEEEGVQIEPGSKLDPAQFGPEGGVQFEPRSNSAAPGEERRSGTRMGVLNPTKEKPIKENHQPTIAGELGGKTEIRKAPSKEEGQEGAKRPWIGVSIAPHDLRHPTGLWKIFQAAVRTGRVGERDALPCLAFLAWVNDQPDAGKGAIHDKGAFIVAALSGDRANWSHRFSPPHFARAKEVFESIGRLQTGRGAPPSALLSPSRREGEPDAD